MVKLSFSSVFFLGGFFNSDRNVFWRKSIGCKNKWKKGLGQKNLLRYDEKEDWYISTDSFCSRRISLFVVSTSLPQSNTRWLWSTFSSHCLLSSKQQSSLQVYRLTNSIPQLINIAKLVHCTKHRCDIYSTDCYLISLCHFYKLNEIRRHRHISRSTRASALPEELYVELLECFVVAVDQQYFNINPTLPR